MQSITAEIKQSEIEYCDYLKVKDGTTWVLDRDCKAYQKPLADVPLRFTNELHDTIETVKCSDLSTKEFYDKYIRLKIPVKIKDCKHSQIDNGWIYVARFGQE